MASFVNARESVVKSNCVANSVKEYLKMFLDGSPLGHSLSEETEDTLRNIARYAAPGKGISIPGEFVIVYASKPSLSTNSDHLG